jgi:hypothetical protein
MNIKWNVKMDEKEQCKPKSNKLQEKQDLFGRKITIKYHFNYQLREK